MVKTIRKSIISRGSTEKRVRGIKRKIKSTKSKKQLKRRQRKIKSKLLYLNYYLNSKINVLLSEEENALKRLKMKEDSEFKEEETRNSEIYQEKDRKIAIIGLQDMIGQVLESNPTKVGLFPDNLDASVISLFDYYLKRAKKQLTQSDLIKILFSSLLYIDKEKNLRVFNKTFLNNFELSLNFLEVVDFNIYPVKVFDYFEIFFLRISQTNKEDKKHQEYIKEFKKVFIAINFYLNYNDNSKKYRPYDKFIYCLLMTKSFLNNNNFIRDEIVDHFIEYYKRNIQFDENIYQTLCIYIKQAKYSYDDLVNVLKVNNLCKQGLISAFNFNCI